MYYNKMSHKKPSVISDIMKKYLEDLSIVIGNKHTLLGINIEIKESIIQVDMVEQLEE